MNALDMEQLAAAYSFYESRGRQDGLHVEDWLRAEKELMGRYA